MADFITAAEDRESDLVMATHAHAPRGGCTVPAQTDPIMGMDPSREEALHSAQSCVEGLSGPLQTSGLPVETKAVRGEVAPNISAVAEETGVNVIVMSTHALTGPASAMLRSVADAVVRNSQRPEFLVRRPGGVFDVTEGRASAARRRGSG